MTGKTVAPAGSSTDIRTDYIQHGGYRFALLTLINATGRPATMDSTSLTNFANAVRALNVSEVDAVAVSGKGSVFCAGADLKRMLAAATSEEAQEVARQGLEAFGSLEELPVPTFAFINGLALGGGLELALHARHRVAADSVRALGFPEVRLGLTPGWGGIPRTVALVGPDITARLMVTDSMAGRYLTARAAAELGLVDAVLPQERFLAASLDFAAGILKANTPTPSTLHFRVPCRPESGTPFAAPLAALEDTRTEIDARLSGAAPAPYLALELIAGATHRSEAAQKAAEIEAFGELLLSDQARASIYAFQITQSLSKNPAGRPDVEPLPVRSVGVVGAGLMASQLALVFARQLGVPVHITDLSQDRVDRALLWVRDQLDMLVNRGRLDAVGADSILNLVTGGVDITAFAGCDAVIEAVFEKLEVKQDVFAEVERLVRPDTLLLTNTSSLSLEAMGTGLARPERLIGFHFFNPVAVLPLVEIITTPLTDPTIISTAFELARRLGKTPVLAADTAGFVVNRILTRLFSEVLSLLDDGADPDTVNHALDPLGLPMRPLQLLQFIGPAVQLHICETMHKAYPQRFIVSHSLKKLVTSGLPGYLDRAGRISPAAAPLLPAPKAISGSVVCARILAALSEEVTAMLEEDVVAGPEQVDLCMILGANFPFHTGGLTPLLDRETGSAFHPQLRVPVAGSR